MKRKIKCLRHDKKQLRKAAVINAIANIQDLILRVEQTPRYHDGRHAAFTLAEVLITLGIIGIVAAMTIPTLVAKYQEKAWNTSATVFERKLEEALKVMNTRETLAGYNNTKDFVNELANHFKINKICDNPVDCFEDTVYWETDGTEVNMAEYTTAQTLGQNKWSTETLGVQFGNGTSGVIAYNDYDCKQDPFSNQIIATSCIALVYDTTGNSKPNAYGKDLRAINAELGGCAFIIDGTCYGAPFWPSYLTYSECKERQSELGLDYCYNGNDYYAGAAAACGGKQNLPSQEQLTKLAEYVYNTSSINSIGTTYDVTLDTEKASALGFDVSSGVFLVWCSQEYSSDLAYNRYFGSTHTSWGYAYTSPRKANHTTQAVCIGG